MSVKKEDIISRVKLTHKKAHNHKYEEYKKKVF